jgi:ABC-type phosphate transport system substrate-binding protein
MSLAMAPMPIGAPRRVLAMTSRVLMPILVGWLMNWLPVVALAVEVIAHPSVATNRLSLVTAKAMFGMRQTRWPDGNPVRVFVLPDGHFVHQAFSKEVLNLYPYQLRQTWDRQVYSGTGQAPVEVATEEEMLARVSRTPGAIGYVRKVNVNEPVRVIPIQ